MNIITLLCVLASSSLALTLQDIRNQIHTSSSFGDTVEIQERTTVTTANGMQVVNIHVARKGPQKVYTELRSSTINQLSIMSGNQLQIVPFKAGNAAQAGTLPTPLDTGNWSDPVKSADGTYLLSDGSTQVNYDTTLQRITQIFMSTTNGSQYTTTMQYNADRTPKSMLTVAATNGTQTQVLVEFLLYQSAKNFPDRFFQF